MNDDDFDDDDAPYDDPQRRQIYDCNEAGGLHSAFMYTRDMALCVQPNCHLLLEAYPMDEPCRCGPDGSGYKCLSHRTIVPADYFSEHDFRQYVGRRMAATWRACGFDDDLPPHYLKLEPFEHCLPKSAGFGAGSPGRRITIQGFGTVACIYGYQDRPDDQPLTSWTIVGCPDCLGGGGWRDLTPEHTYQMLIEHSARCWGLSCPVRRAYPLRPPLAVQETLF